MENAGISSNNQEVKNSDKQVSLDIGNLEECMKRELETLRLHPLSNQCCIYRVPEQLRELNGKAYTPRVVSIGPLHHGKQELKAMEQHKRRYLIDFLQRSELNLLDLIKATEKYENRMKESYTEIIDIPREEFIKLMLVDSAFIIEYFFKLYFKEYRCNNDRVFGKQRMTNNIRFDLLLLENQVPFFFLVYLFNLSNNDHEGLSMIKLVQTFLTSEVGVVDNKKLLEMTSSQVQHLVDFLRISLSPSDLNPKKQFSSLSTPTVTHLHQAGVKFKSSSSKCLLDIKFKNGILEIPKWIITDPTEVIFRNIQAFEQCHNSNKYLGDYIFIMDLLINSPEDVELLVQNKIIENWIQDSQAVATFINNLGKQNLIYDDFYFSGLIEDLNAYCEIPRHKWKATLKQKYFNNPWTIISVIAATFLLILTVIQSVCSILQVV